MSTTTVSLLLPDIGQNAAIHAAVLGVESSSTSYLLACPSETSDDEEEMCGLDDVTVTLGQWAEKTVPPGAAKTGDFDMDGEPNYGKEPASLSLHCEMSGTKPLGCTQTNSGFGMGHYTATINAASDLAGFQVFSHFPVTVTSGVDKLTQTGSQTEKTSDADETESTTGGSGDAEQTGSQTGDADGAEETGDDEDAATSALPRVFAAAVAAGLAAIWML